MHHAAGRPSGAVTAKASGGRQVWSSEPAHTCHALQVAHRLAPHMHAAHRQLRNSHSSVKTRKQSAESQQPQPPIPAAPPRRAAGPTLRESEHPQQRRPMPVPASSPIMFFLLPRHSLGFRAAPIIISGRQNKQVAMYDPKNEFHEYSSQYRLLWP